jgi:hypothetical protein
MRLLLFLLATSAIQIDDVCELQYDPPPLRRVSVLQCVDIPIFKDDFE